MDILIYLMVFGPMAASFLSFLIGKKSKSGRDCFVRVTVAAEFLLSLYLLVLFGNEAGEGTENAIIVPESLVYILNSNKPEDFADKLYGATPDTGDEPDVVGA